MEKTFVYDILELMEQDDISPYYASALDLSWLSEPYPYPVRRGTLASADSDLLPEKIPLLKSKGAIAADWESAALAWVAQKNKARLLILRGVSDIVHEQGSDAYNNYEIFKARTRGDHETTHRAIAGLAGFGECIISYKYISIACSSPRSE